MRKIPWREQPYKFHFSTLAEQRGVPVVSSNIRRVSWSTTTNEDDDPEMFVQFHGGGVYSYRGVPKQSFTKMIHAASVGKFFWRNVRDQYPTQRWQ